MDLDLNLLDTSGHPLPNASVAPPSVAPSSTTEIMSVESPSISRSSSPLPRPVGPGIGKPSIGKKFGKMNPAVGGAVTRPRVRIPLFIIVVEK